MVGVARRFENDPRHVRRLCEEHQVRARTSKRYREYTRKKNSFLRIVFLFRLLPSPTRKYVLRTIERYVQIARRKVHGAVRRIQEGVRRGIAQMAIVGRPGAGAETPEHTAVRRARERQVAVRVQCLREDQSGSAVRALQAAELSVRHMSYRGQRFV